MSATAAMLDLNDVRYLRCSLGLHPLCSIGRSRYVRKGINLSTGNVSSRQQCPQQTAVDTQYDVQSILIFVLGGAHFIAPRRSAESMPANSVFACRRSVVIRPRRKLLVVG